MSPQLVAIAMTPDELALLLHAVKELIERDDDPRAWDVLAMLENALPAGLVASLAPEEALRR